MSCKAVFLDAATVSCEPVSPDCVDEWVVHSITPAKLVGARIADADIVITNKVRIGANELKVAKRLKLIIVAATGYDIIDLPACKKRGIAVANSPGYSNSSVPEHAVALMFALARSIVPLHRQAVDGTWSKAKSFCLHTMPISELRNRTVGIIGAGNLGRATGSICAALGMNVIYRASNRVKSDNLVRMPLAKLLTISDFVSLHCPLDEDSKHLINAETLAMMRPEAILINTARGGLVDATAVVEALQEGNLGGAGIDVLEIEPPAPDHPFLTCSHPRLIVTPHVAWASTESQMKLIKMIAETADSFFADQPVNLVS